MMMTGISRELAAAHGYLGVRAHPSSLACFKAFNQNMAPGDLPHPVRARNIGLLRPPKSACYILLGEEMQQAIVPAPDASHQVEGIYVLEAENTGRRTLSFVTISRTSTEGRPGCEVESIEIIIHNEQEPLIEVIRKIVGNSADAELAIAHHQSIVQLCAKVFLYYNLPETRRIEKQDYTAALAAWPLSPTAARPEEFFA